MKTFKQFLLEQDTQGKLVVIFPGRFQPFHTGHKKLYEMAKRQFPSADFYIATAEPNPKQILKEPDRYPFTFDEKKQIIQATGIPENEIVKTTQPYRPVEILQKYNPDIDSVIFLVGKKDMEEDPRFAFTPTRSGAPSYFQPFTSFDNMKPFTQDGGHGYVYAPGTIEFDVDGKRVEGATQLRQEYKAGDDKKRMRIIINVVGSPNRHIFELFNKKLK